MATTTTNDIKILDYFTNIALEAIWKENVAETIINDIETGKTYPDSDWDIVEPTPFTEPFWGITVNK